ncbi:peroxidase mlt-7 [Octopus bimaculoides]|uniref:Uncharacterized protein n=1 Tax=Octopus bimaculoides TaxID=37653 RepID=A0A0L8GZ01_OCTBM|nr:peroxidase mlt-7 [Octopus bimaculoides]|eukprot:XP_014776816.1 PREDICTED: peroxidase mlt-7-like [Octopus bimaculoides]
MKNPLVMALYHVFLREHNRLVETLTPACGSTGCRNEARTLLIAMFQHIVCNEYLPLLLGSSARCLNTSNYTYDNTSSPMVSNAFAVAYKLVGASMLRDTVTIGGNLNVSVKTILNDSTQVDSDLEMTNIVNGMLTDYSLKIGREIPCSFRDDCQYSDIVSVLIQDTRYFGIPPYFVWLALTVNSTDMPSTIDNLPYQTPANLIATDSSYQNLYDIDFLTGALSENVVPGAMVGPTLKRLFEDTFNSLQRGDRLYFDNAGVFTDDQLNVIRNVTMAQLLCRNVEGLTEVKENAFVHNSPLVQCSSFPDIDFCRYCNSSTGWTAFVTVPNPCFQFQLKYRFCQSTNPVACPCLGSPFEITPCPSAIVDSVMYLQSRVLESIMANDTQSKDYHAIRDETNMIKRMLELYEEHFTKSI